jgi:hypothetical protein
MQGLITRRTTLLGRLLPAPHFFHPLTRGRPGPPKARPLGGFILESTPLALVPPRNSLQPAAR